MKGDKTVCAVGILWMRMNGIRTWDLCGMWYVVCGLWCVMCVGGEALDFRSRVVGLLAKSFTSRAPHGLFRLAYHNINASGLDRPRHFTGKVTRFSAPVEEYC